MEERKIAETIKSCSIKLFNCIDDAVIANDFNLEANYNRIQMENYCSLFSNAFAISTATKIQLSLLKYVDNLS